MVRLFVFRVGVFLFVTFVVGAVVMGGKWNGMRELAFQTWLRRMEIEFMTRYWNWCQDQGIKPDFNDGYYWFLVGGEGNRNLK
jgi:hypothetical protein